MMPPFRYRGSGGLRNPWRASRKARPRLPHLDRGPGGGGALVRELNRLLPRAVEEEKAADHLLGLGERAVGRRPLAIPGFDPHGFHVRLERLDALQHASLLQAVREPDHLVVQVAADLLRAVPPVAAVFHDQQCEWHRMLLRVVEFIDDRPPPGPSITSAPARSASARPPSRTRPSRRQGGRAYRAGRRGHSAGGDIPTGPVPYSIGRRDRARPWARRPWQQPPPGST